jgi:hypothetical protein
MRTRAAIVSLLLLACGFLRAQQPQEAPIDAQLYYSKDDPTWRETEKAVDAVVQKIPRLRIEKISIDTDEGYQKLAAAEKANLFTRHGDITLVMGPIMLSDKEQRRDIETYLEPMLVRLLHPEKAKGKLQANIAAFEKDVFGDGAVDEKLPATEQENIVYHRVKKVGKDAGWVVEAYSHIGCPVCNDVQFVVAFDSDLKILDLKPVRELERYGRTLDEKETSAFVSQFKGRSAEGKAVQVDGISGATKTSHSYENTLNEVLKGIREKAGVK